VHPYTLRAARWPLALSLVVVAACADDPPTTAPNVPPGSVTRQALDGNVILVTNASGANVPGSLQWAVGMAGGTSVIQFDAGLAGDTIPLDATLEPFPYITIEGPADKGITITNSSGRIIRLRQGGRLRNVTLTGGSDGPGSAIWTQGPLTLEHSTVSNNHGSAAAIHGHEITLVNSTVSGNSGSGPASGISVASAGYITLINSTVAHNEGAPGIGWLMSPGSTPLVTLRNSIVANNGSGTRNCDSWLLFDHQGMNISSDSTCGVSTALIVANPMLLGLADNGGPTATEAIHHQSPAFNGGVSCSVTVDQRYVSRGTSCDIGAFEFTDFTVVTLTIDANATAAANGTSTVTGTVRCSRAGDRFGVNVELEQQQKVGKTTTLVLGTGGTAVTCTTSTQPFSASVTPSTGAFVAGTATASASTNNTPAWVTPSAASRAVKLVRPRR